MQLNVSHKGVWQRFIGSYVAYNTIKRYRRVVEEFLQSIYGDDIDPAEAADRYFEEAHSGQRDVELDVINYLKSKVDIAPISFRGNISILRLFLEEGGIELRRSFWRRIRSMKKGTTTIAIDRAPTKQELRRLLQHLPIQGRALILTLASSGMRIGEALQIRLSDINLDEDPPKIDIKPQYTKSGDRRWVFISTEAKEAILEWLKIRESYLKSAAAKIKHMCKKPTDDDRVFPMSHSNVYEMWHRALEKAKLDDRDPVTNRRLLHIHVLRKFFRSQMAAAGVPVDVVEALMGHRGYLTEAYRKYNVQQLAEFYKQGEWSVLIYTEAADLSKLREEFENRIREVQDLNTQLTQENLGLNRRIRDLEQKIADIEQMMLKVVKFVAPILESEDIEELIKTAKFSLR